MLLIYLNVSVSSVLDFNHMCLNQSIEIEGSSHIITYDWPCGSNKLNLRQNLKWNINSRWQTSVFPLKFTHYQNKKIKSTKGHLNMITVTVHFGSRGFFNLKRLICLHWLESVVTFRPSFYKIQSTIFKTDTGTIVSVRLREMSIL